MNIDISSILMDKESVISFKETVVPTKEETEELNLNSWSPIEAEGNIFKSQEGLLLHLSISFEYSIPCDRCLRNTNKKISASSTYLLMDKGEETIVDDSLDIAFYSNMYYNPKGEILETAYLAFPNKHLCKENCAGLCPKCGVILDSEKCNCKDEDIDPRLEVLKNYFDDK